MNKYKKIFFIFSIFLLSTLLNSRLMAFENIDECGVFKNKIIEQHTLYSLEEAQEQEFTSIYFQRIITPDSIDGPAGFGDFARTDENNLLIESIIPSIDLWELANKYPAHTEVVKINSADVNKLTDEEIGKMIDNILANKSELTIQVRVNKEQTRTIVMPAKQKITGVQFDQSIYSISDIDSSKSTYKAHLINSMKWWDDRLGKIAAEVHKSLKLNKYLLVDNDVEDAYWTCEFSKQDWLEMNLWQPKLSYLNMISKDNNDNTDTFIIDFFPKGYKYGDDEIEEEYNAQIKITKDVIATFKGYFDFKAFPFDSQNIDFNYFLSSTYTEVYPWFSNDELIAVSNFSNLEFTEWKKQNYSYKYIRYDDPKVYGSTAMGLQFTINVDRNFEYYILKIFLPIIIILLVAWSCFWVSPKELEARLTVSIVCLLSLIAYTFVIDKGIPKLSYLTIMDYGVLVAYIFSTIPTFESIYVRRVADKHLHQAKKIDKLFLIFTPITFIFIFIFIFYIQVNQSTNIIKSFAF